MIMLCLALLVGTVADTVPPRGSISRLDVSALPRAQIMLSMPLGDGRWVARPRAADFVVSTEGGAAVVKRAGAVAPAARSDMVVLDPSAPVDLIRSHLEIVRDALDGRAVAGDELTVVTWNDSVPVVIGPGAPSAVVQRVLASLPDSTVALPAAMLSRARRMWAARPASLGNVLVVLPRSPIPMRALTAFSGAVAALPGSVMILAAGSSAVRRTIAAGLDGGADVANAARLWALLQESGDSVAVELDVELAPAPEGAEQHVSVALASPVDSSSAPLVVSYLSLAPGRFSLAGGEMGPHSPRVLLLAVGGGMLLLTAVGAGLYWSRRTRDDA